MSHIPTRSWQGWCQIRPQPLLTWQLPGWLQGPEQHLNTSPSAAAARPAASRSTQTPWQGWGQIRPQLLHTWQLPGWLQGPELHSSTSPSAAAASPAASQSTRRLNPDVSADPFCPHPIVAGSGQLSLSLTGMQGPERHPDSGLPAAAASPAAPAGPDHLPQPGPVLRQGPVGGCLRLLGAPRQLGDRAGGGHAVLRHQAHVHLER